jgi:hypothetical protein
VTRANQGCCSAGAPGQKKDRGSRLTSPSLPSFSSMQVSHRRKPGCTCAGRAAAVQLLAASCISKSPIRKFQVSKAGDKSLGLLLAGLWIVIANLQSSPKQKPTSTAVRAALQRAQLGAGDGWPSFHQSQRPKTSVAPAPKNIW